MKQYKSKYNFDLDDGGHHLSENNCVDSEKICTKPENIEIWYGKKISLL